MNLKKHLKKIPLLLLPLGTVALGLSATVNTAVIEKNTEEKEFSTNFLNNTTDIFKKYFDSLNITGLREKVKNIKGPNIGIIDTALVDPNMFIRDDSNPLSSKIIHITDTIEEISSKKSGKSFKKYTTNPKDSNLNLLKNVNSSYNLNENSRHATQIANIMGGRYGISQNSDIYSVALYDENRRAKDFEAILNTFLVNNVKIVNMSLGYSAHFNRFINELFYKNFQRNLYKYYYTSVSLASGKEDLETFYSKPENKIAVLNMCNIDISSKTQAESSAYFNIMYSIYEKAMSSQNESLSMIIWRNFFGFDNELNTIVQKYAMSLSMDDITKKDIEENYKKYANNFLEALETTFLKDYLYKNIYGKKGDFNINELQELVKMDSITHLLNDYNSNLMDKYANRYGMKFVISAGNDEMALFLQRLIHERNSKNNQYEFNKFDYFNTDSQQFNKNSKNVIYVGSINENGYQSAFSNQGDSDRDDYPFVSSYGEMPLNTLNISDKYKSNKFVNYIFNDLIGTSYAAPTIAGSLAVLESNIYGEKASQFEKTMNIPLLKAALISSSKYKKDNGDYFNEKWDMMNTNTLEGYVLHNNNAHRIQGYGTPDFEKVEKYFEYKNKDYLQLNPDAITAHKEINHDSLSNFNKTYLLNTSSIEGEIKEWFDINYDMNAKIITISLPNERLTKEVRIGLSWDNVITYSDFSILRNIFAKYEKKDSHIVEDAYEDLMNIMDLKVLPAGMSDIERTQFNPLTLTSSGKNSTSEMILINDKATMNESSNNYAFDIYLVFSNPKLKEKYSDISEADLATYTSLKLDIIKRCLARGLLPLTIGVL
ncbi:S8 family serine peptidase [Mycoplasma sp. BRA290]|uniref:S8 family serine peptidase n=1 Tax=unclassified Mycoplasma TaxID=2683645 RepID=UPI003AAC4518